MGSPDLLETKKIRKTQPKVTMFWKSQLLAFCLYKFHINLVNTVQLWRASWIFSVFRPCYTQNLIHLEIFFSFPAKIWTTFERHYFNYILIYTKSFKSSKRTSNFTYFYIYFAIFGCILFNQIDFKTFNSCFMS